MADAYDSGLDDEDFELDKVSRSTSGRRKASSAKGSGKKRSRVDEEDDDDDDMPLSQLVPVTSTTRVAKKGKTGTKKDLPPLKQLEAAMQAFKWWEKEKQEGGNKWTTFEHNGVMFPPNYKPHGVKLLYDGVEVDLTPEQEEVATLYAEIPLDGPQLGNAKTAATFNKNFFSDFKQVLGRGHVIQKFNKLDFSRIREHVQREREERKNMSKEAKELKKKAADADRVKFSFAMIDGSLQKVGNVMVEPPGLFRGRGDHPKTGRLKKRVMPEQVTINIGEDSPVPPCPVPGHSWGKIVHKKDVTWLAFWKENIMDQTKYVWLSASSGFKGEADMAKYEKARELNQRIGVIRGDYERKLTAKELEVRQLGTAMWVIDRLALRVGNEKSDDEADTFGCCSLRKEHVTVDRVKKTLTLDFLGKDSMRHFQEYHIVDQYGVVGERVLKNFQLFLKGKSANDDVFEKLDVSTLNAHLKTLMPGLSAKVFRTMNASYTLQAKLEYRVDPLLTEQEKTALYNAANKEVAILCNHQKTVSTAAQSTIEKLASNIDTLKLQLEELHGFLRKRKNDRPIKLKEELSPTATKEEKMAVQHLFSKQPKPEDVDRRIQSWEKKIRTAEINYQMKEENKSVALGTSKINYMDPRITAAWCKRNECPIERVFAGALREKFPWAMSVPESFHW
mmetsp:Transcript_22764/g.40336  ORF Transcript_22764/g.40336 Transcript_22764/m.40336 type:complete len:675 (-) Transcript_22764:84-2108(-)